MLIPALAGAAAAAAVTAGFHTMWPTSQLYGHTFVGNGRNSRQLALTFDDGPNDVHTQKLLEVLDRHAVKATFFMIGKFVEQRPEIVRAVARAGHAIGNHTYSHPNLIFKNRFEVRRELRECSRALRAVLGTYSRLFRPPHGGRRPEVLKMVSACELIPVMWSVSGWDWKPHSAEEIARKVHQQVRGGDVILLHDGSHERMGADRSNSVKATDLMLRRFKGEGYEFVTVPAMMKLHDNPHQFTPAAG